MIVNISKKGLDLIKSFEGCRLTAYRCPANVCNVWTIGWGHTADVYEGMKITQAQADAFLVEDMKKYEAYVRATGLTLNQNQFDALVSFTYNCGNGNLKTLIKNRTLPQIADALLLYNKGGGKVLNGLVRRRKAERELFLSAVEKAEEKANTQPSEHITSIAKEVIAGKYGNGHEERKERIYEAVRKEVNRLLK